MLDVFFLRTDPEILGGVQGIIYCSCFMLSLRHHSHISLRGHVRSGWNTPASLGMLSKVFALVTTTHMFKSVSRNLVARYAVH